MNRFLAIARRRDTDTTRELECDATGALHTVATIALGATTIVDGGDATQGAIADPVVATDAPGTVSAKLRGIVSLLFNRLPVTLGQKTKAGSLAVTLASDEDALPVTGTFFQVTQPVSIAANVPVSTRAPYMASLTFRDIEADTMYQLIDLSDDTNYPHQGSETNALILKHLILHVEKVTTGVFELAVGVVVENDASDGTMKVIHTYHLEANGNPTDATDRFAQELPYDLDLEVATGVLVKVVTNEQLADDILLQNDVARTSPVGTGNPGVGDLMFYANEITDGGKISGTISALYDAR